MGRLRQGRIMGYRSLTALACAGLLAAAPALAGTTTVGFLTNVSMTGFTGGSVYAPLFDLGIHTLGGVPFQLGDLGSNALYGAATNTPVDIAGATTAYTLVSSYRATVGHTVGYITFHGSAGATYTYNFVEGLNTRDQYLGSFNNVTTSPDVTQAVWGDPAAGAHLDMQTIALPAAFRTQTLDNVYVNMLDQDGGRGILVGVSVAAIPEPSAGPMLLLGLGVLAAARRLRARTR
jgi:hypothetical protein